jgi:2-polyprenyl-6-hydroxyphenyl methylase/3-demethylubiquinone-9 3-methyltransferase
MWRALELAQSPVARGGLLFIALYNDQGEVSKAWRRVKRVYNRLPPVLRPALMAMVVGPRELLVLGHDVLTGRPGRYVRRWTHYERRARGMSRWHDLVDWMGGYPYEVAKPDEVFDFLRARGFSLERLVTCGGGSGCNQYVLRRVGAHD